MNFALARENMVKSQILPNKVTEPEILDVLFSVAREEFVDEEHREIAYSDYPVSNGVRRCLVPLQIARIIQAVKVQQGDKVLVVGAGTGYEALLFSKLGATVFALESDADLVQRGEKLTQGTGIQWKTGDLAAGWPEQGPFQGIVYCGSVEEIPTSVSNLARNGRLVAIVGKSESPVMEMLLIEGFSGGGRPTTVFQTVADILPGMGASPRFEL